MASGDDSPIDELAATLGRRVAERRRNFLEVSRTELASRIGMSQPSLRDIEHGATWPRPENLRALRDKLQASFGWLLGDEVSQDEVDVGRWVLSLPTPMREALLLNAKDRPGIHPPPAALTEASASPAPPSPAAEPAPQTQSAPDDAERPHRASTQTQRAG